jgi:hypothetical protein
MEDYTVTSVDFFADENFASPIYSYAVPTPISDPGITFFGLESTTPFRSIRINLSSPLSEGGFSPYMDDFLFEPANAAAVPEPATMALVGVGLGFASLARRRKRNR